MYIYTLNIKELGSSSMLLITYANNGKLCDVAAITYHSHNRLLCGLHLEEKNAPILILEVRLMHIQLSKSCSYLLRSPSVGYVFYSFLCNRGRWTKCGK